MAGTISPGQTLTPNPNVLAVAGMGGDVWGANGGGAVAIGGGVTGQTGYGKPVAATLSDGETATTYMQSTQTANFPSVKGQESNAAVSGQTLDSTLASGGNNAG
jgi:hypothetical protein